MAWHWVVLIAVVAFILGFRVALGAIARSLISGELSEKLERKSGGKLKLTFTTPKNKGN